MREGSFDELAKGLATNRLSRGQVLKSLAAGVLLAGPLGALLNRTAWAQTIGCVDTSCTESAQQAYAACTKRCKRKRGKKRKKCLAACNGTFSDQSLNCGCSAVDLDTATGKVAFSACDDPCTPQTLFNQANQDINYVKLTSHLTNDEGFVVDGEPKSIVLYEDGDLLRTALMTSYFQPSRTNETARLFYTVEAVGETDVFATVLRDGVVQYGLFVDAEGQVQQVYPIQQVEADSTTTASDAKTTSTSFAESASNDEAASKSGAAGTATAMSPESCKYWCNLGCSSLVGEGCSGFLVVARCAALAHPVAILVCTAVAVLVCEAAEGVACDPLCSKWCGCQKDDGTQGIACGDTCCWECEVCEISANNPSGVCKPMQCSAEDCMKCDPTINRCATKCHVGSEGSESCCDGECRDLKTDNRSCGSCDNACPPKLICHSGQCVCPAGRECGDTCCGKCEKCVDTIEGVCATKSQECGGTCCDDPGAWCNNGKCESFCDSGETMCNFSCCRSTDEICVPNRFSGVRGCCVAGFHDPGMCHDVGPLPKVCCKQT